MSYSGIWFAGKRKWEQDDKREPPVTDSIPTEKRARLDAAVADGIGIQSEFFVEQRLVGWIIGRNGGVLREIEQEYGVVVVLDQTSKDLGYSRVIVAGNVEKIAEAHEHMNMSLARADGSDGKEVTLLLDAPPTAPGSDNYEEVRVEQDFIGWVLGRGGSAVREIEQDSGCKVCINQETKAMGYSRVQLHGALAARERAKALIQESLDRASMSVKPQPPWKVPAQAQGGELRIEQAKVGYLLGRGGSMLREIEAETGTTIDIDQTSKSFGFSTCRIAGPPTCVEAAKRSIIDCMDKIGGGIVTRGMPVHTACTKLNVEQKWIGWLLGRGGQVMREIEAASGTHIKINQDTKDSGYSIAEITGPPHGMGQAKDLILDQLSRVAPPGTVPATLANGQPAVLSGAPLKNPASILRGAETGPPGGVNVYALQLAKQIANITETARATSADPKQELVQQLLPILTNLVDQKAIAAAATLSAAGAAAALTGDSSVFAPTETPAALAASQPKQLELQVEQRLIGWVLGKKGATVREIEAHSGATVSVDQSFADQGYSVIRLEGPAKAVEAARRRVEASLALVDSTSSAMRVHHNDYAQGAADLGGGGDLCTTEHMQVEQRFVGWILGRSGVVLREIEMNSGAKVSIDQSSKDLGFSTMSISGTQHQCRVARDLVSNKIAQADTPSGQY